MKKTCLAAIVADGLAPARAGGAAAESPSVGTDHGSMIEHHSTVHSIRPCGMHPCPERPNS